MITVQEGFVDDEALLVLSAQPDHPGGQVAEVRRRAGRAAGAVAHPRLQEPVEPPPRELLPPVQTPDPRNHQQQVRCFYFDLALILGRT